MAITNRITLLAGATAAGATGAGQTQGAGDGPIFNLDFPYPLASWQIEYPNGAPASLAGSILGLIDGQTWGTLATFTQATTSGTITALTNPTCVKAIKANISSISGGSVNLFVSLWSAS